MNYNKKQKRELEKLKRNNNKIKRKIRKIKRGKLKNGNIIKRR